METLLQRHGVPVSRSATSEDLCNDAQLAHRNHFILAEHAELGPVPIENSRFILSETSAQIRRAGPTFGQDNDYVLREILGMGDEAIVELIAAGALE
jgi:benzylsuccinate CoA-transferase BbsF subunit